jgi:anti-sigma B factor antagonist
LIMTITKTTNGNTVTLALAGRLDTVTSAQLTDELASTFEAGAIDLIFDLGALDYISSAGLRVLLTAQKRINALGTKMKITNANDTVKEIFDVTGFSSILQVE